MRVLVTGGTGFIGSNLVLELVSQGHEVLVTGNDTEQKLPGFSGKFLHHGLIGIDWGKIGKLDAVFHQAAITDTTVYDRDEMLRANLESPKELFRRAVEAGSQQIVYASSTAVYGNLPAPYKESGPTAPLNPYGESKKLLDDFAMEFAAKHPDVTVVGLRYCNVYGPRENHKGNMASMVYQLARQMKTGNPRIFKFGEQKRDFVYVKDVVRANVLSLKAKESIIIILNCATGHATSFNEIIAVLNDVMKLDRRTEYIENPYGDKYQSHIECDMALVESVIGFTPHYDIRSGIADYFASGFLV